MLQRYGARELSPLLLFSVYNSNAARIKGLRYVVRCALVNTTVVVCVYIVRSSSITWCVRRRVVSRPTSHAHHI